MPSVTKQQLPDPTPHRHLDETAQERLRELEAAHLPAHALRRTGQRPYAFNGALVAMICGVTPLLPYWYELNVYRTVLGTCVSDVRLFHKSPDRTDMFRVVEHDDLEKAFDYFERYVPAADISPEAALLNPGTSNTELALHTARLQMQVNQITDHFRGLAGELLKGLQTQAG